MSPKTIVMFGMTVGSLTGSYLPTLFGVSAFSIISLITGAIGGLLGIYISYRFSQYMDS